MENLSILGISRDADMPKSLSISFNKEPHDSTIRILHEYLQDFEVLDRFNELASIASYHFADDSAREWYLGESYKKEAIGLYDNNPQLKQHFLKIMEKQLWSLKY